MQAQHGERGFEQDRELRSSSFYLTRMGWVWLTMVAPFALGMITWLGLGLGRAALVVAIAPMVVLRSRWERLLRGYSEAMGRGGLQPFSNRDRSLIAEALSHTVDPARPPRSRRERHAGRRGRGRLFALLPLGLGAWVPLSVGLRSRRLSWSVQGAVCSLLVGAGWILIMAHPHGGPSLAGDLILIGWCGAMGSAYHIHRAARAD